MVMLAVVITIRLHAMYEGSRKILIFLVVTLLALSIAAGVLLFIDLSYTRGEQFVLSGTYQCRFYFVDGRAPILIGSEWVIIAGLVWEVLALCLTVWVAIRHLRELQRRSTRWTVRDCFTVLIKTHAPYFAAFAVASFSTLSNQSLSMNPSAVGVQIHSGAVQIITAVQLFVLGPRLVLSVRAYYAQLLVDSDEGIAMTPITFQEPLPE
ncbi:hypothetical protein DEU56DRAFT_804350 [Suillus clintonianus]|uniref:uncharacterized protein n=1 Tax=Suillus clintonianus TaxID=1904413 RepID=UPI001B880590|nr:uncharacterized protein DEU56DRAFT_804350 [Suillus clintonianus]KAG2137537.1 hypothetical protein DEU56DRAFT_804350 [Suillus clintonianus]